jgi:CRP-like cAMP-binding protein
VSAQTQRRRSFAAALTAAERSALHEAGRPRRFAPGQAVFREGDEAGFVVVIVSGRVKVSVSGVGGRDLVLAFPGPGELVGEIAAVSGRPRSATVTAMTDVDALAIATDEFRRFVSRHARVASLVFEHLAALLAVADRQRVDLATRDVTGRVAARLLELASAGEERDPRSALTLSQEELATWTGASREAVAKSLRVLRELGWVETSRRQVKVLDAEALRTLVR